MDTLEIKGKTICPKCKHTVPTVMIEVEPKVFDYTGSVFCQKCGHGYEPEDFHADFYTETFADKVYNSSFEGE